MTGTATFGIMSKDNYPVLGIYVRSKCDDAITITGTLFGESEGYQLILNNSEARAQIPGQARAWLVGYLHFAPKEELSNVATAPAPSSPEFSC